MSAGSNFKLKTQYSVLTTLVSFRIASQKRSLISGEKRHSKKETYRRQLESPNGCTTHVCDVFQVSARLLYYSSSSKYSKASGIGIGVGFETCCRGHALTSDCYLWGPFRWPPLYFRVNSISTATFYIATAPQFHAVNLKSCSFCCWRRQLPSSSVCLGSSRYGFTLYLWPFHDHAYFAHYRP